MKLLKYRSLPNNNNESEFGRKVQQLVHLATALAGEIETLQAELATAPRRDGRSNFDHDGIDFYKEVERYEIELITSALDLCSGNQTHAARLLQLKSTTLNAKIKHYGLNQARSLAV